MTKEQETLLALIKTVVKGECEEAYGTGACCANVMEDATRQGVQGLCLDAFERLPMECRPDKKILLEWLGRVVPLERFYQNHLKTIDALSRFYRQNGIKMMLLKGYGLSLYWPKPNHRPAGDMDIYLGEAWQEADKLVSEKLGIKVDDGHEHHTCFFFQGTSVENHYDFVNTKINE